MPRHARAANSPDNDSLKENRVKQEKDVKVKTEKKSGTKRAEAEEHDEEEEEHDGEQQTQQNGAEDDEEDDDDEENGHGSPKGQKRSRINTDGDSRPTLDPIVKTQPRDTDGYIPGQIVRVQLENFLTYDYADFNCGPYLNMIIGPNGTGKSSIACAIALGLNWPPAILGRAENISSFVKNDKNEGYVEIELKGPKGRPNLVIRRNLAAKNKSNSFTLNGRACTGKDVSAKMAELNVQISNLCTFLPQDKVSSFAMMTPRDLLKETQRAAGNRNLTTWHEILIKAGKEHRSMLQTVKDDEERLKQMQERNDAIEKEVERYQERKRIEDQIELLNVFIPGAQYDELLHQYHIIKAKQRKLHQKVSKLQPKNDPAHKLLKKMNTQAEVVERERNKKKEETQQNFAKMQQKWRENAKLESEADASNSKIEALEVDEQRRAAKIKILEEEIVRLEEDHNRDVKMESLDDLKHEYNELRPERREIDEKSEENNHQRQEVSDDKDNVQRTMDALRRNLAALESEDGRKLNNLARWDKDAHAAVVWLRSNQHKFRQEIIEPAYLSLTVKDQRYASAVEACFASLQLKTFVAQCREDYDLLNRCINDQNNVFGRKVRVATWFRDPRSVQLIEPPMSPEEMQELQFNGYAIDLVECPEGLKTYLRAELQLHRIAISLNSNINIEKAMEFVSRPVHGHRGGANFITGMTMHSVTRSRYGNHTRSNATTTINPARNLSAQTVDLEQKRNIEAQMNDCQLQLDNFSEQDRQLAENSRAIERRFKDWEEKKAGLDERKKAIEQEAKRKHGIKTKLERAKTSLQTEKSKPTAEAERKKIRREMAQIAMKRAVIARDHLALARRIVEDQTAATRAGIEYFQLQANIAVLKAHCDKKDQKFLEAKEEFNKVDDLYIKTKAESKVALAHAQAVVNEAKREHQEIQSEANHRRAEYRSQLKEAQKNGTEPPSAEGVDLRTVAELEAELEEQYAQLELVTKTNPGVIEQYEKRKRDIEHLESVLQKKHRDAGNVEKTVNSTLAKWKPALDKLVESIGEKFSAAFDRIGCAGEIRIHEHEDYDEWAIDILVKFRDHEKLQLLTGQRQSGGERSLTTILYLMSLTEEARTPFSLVDEINQGMDQRAERVVHNSMVDVTCKDNAGQYFLITPKLLPDLNYHERMKVLCVANGEWLPDETKVGNLMGLLNNYVAGKKAGSSNSH